MSSSAATKKKPMPKYKRKQTPEQKYIQAQKYSATMTKKRAAKEAAMVQSKRQKEENKRVNFFTVRKQKTVVEDSTSSQILSCHVQETSNEGCDEATFPTSVGHCDDDVLVVDNPPIPVELHTADIVNNLDFNDDDGECLESDDDDVDDGDENSGVQQDYVRAIQKRLQAEISGDHDGPQWLLDELKRDLFWIRSHRAHFIVSKLGGLEKHPEAFYRDVYVWLPDVQWSDANKTFMPCCPNCKSNKHVGPHGFRSNHFGRVIVTLSTTYYVMTRRYICHECRKESTQAKEALEGIATEKGLSIEVSDSSQQYTFMGWDKRILPLFKYGRGSKFPAFLTWKAGVDYSVIHLMRLLFLRGVRPEGFAAILLEQHTKRFTELGIEHENETLRKSRGILTPKKEMLGEFGDKRKYRGLVPTGRYVQHVFITHHGLVGPYMDKEVKKRGARSLHWDVSYKEAKHLCRYRGQPVFKGLVTGMNEVGEVRVQFHVYSDSHEQMKSALEAFKRTTQNLGLPEVQLFFTDNPAADKQFYMRMLPSLKVQQNVLDSIVASSAEMQNSTSPSGTSLLPSYPYEQLDVRIATSGDDIANTVRALIEEAIDSRIGLDAEWNVTIDSRGVRSGVSKVKIIQIAYRSPENKMKVLIFKVGNLKKLPQRLVALLSNNTTHIFGANVSADLVKIAKDFNIDEMREVDQKTRCNVHNLGVFARNRDVVTDGGASLEQIVKSVMNISLDKTLQCSDWGGDLSKEQIKYAAIDAAVSLEVGERLQQMPDLTRRLMPHELVPGRKVDLIPMHGRAACMATRAASATIVQSEICICPPGMVYGKRGHMKMKAGRSSYVIQLDKIYSPGLIIPNYYTAESVTSITVDDIPQGHHIIVPISMIKEHVDSVEVRATPIDSDKNMIGMTLPASEVVERDILDTISSDEDVEGREHSADDADASATHDESGDEDIDDLTAQLTSREIDHLQMAIFDKENALSRRIPLESAHLSPPPDPKHIKDKYSVVLGDVFHAMDRAKVPTKHEAKKAYYVALSEAFLIWNPKKLEELTSAMRASGLQDEDVRLHRYFNKRLFCDCVDRHCPAPSILYWRVRAVFVAYGNIIDSKSKEPLFNSRAWQKADNLLKEILEGYYSDPPGINLYTTRMRSDGSVMRNKYGMEMIECSQGTNRTEGYHKNITTTFGTWNAGIEMSDCLLREKRNQHNHNVAVTRRPGYPKTGHSDTWLDEEYQRLVEKNHGVHIYPGLCNTSDYKQTNESFDTIPLQTKRLNNAVTARFNELGQLNLPRTPDQRYLCKAMGSRLPFLPFSGEKEFKAYAKFVNESDYPKDDYEAMIQWCEKYVDGIDILPKLPSHLRIHRDRWDRNQRVKECVERISSTNAQLDELNEKIAPQPQSIHTSESNNTYSSEAACQYPAWCYPMIMPGSSFPLASPEAFVHSDHHGMTVAGISIGASCLHLPAERMQTVISNMGRPKGRQDRCERQRPRCALCMQYEDKSANEESHASTCRGRLGGKNGGAKACQYFTCDGQKKNITSG